LLEEGKVRPGVLAIGIQGLGFRVQGLGFRVWGLLEEGKVRPGVLDRDSGFRV